VKTGVQRFCNGLEILDPGLHRDDGKTEFSYHVSFGNILKHALSPTENPEGPSLKGRQRGFSL
jgi:hypothetical protein